jgi:tetratricopeptide (TPR) repeat protein
VVLDFRFLLHRCPFRVLLRDQRLDPLRQQSVRICGTCISRMDEARQAYEESLKIRRELAQKNPDTYLPDVAGMLNNLGILDRAQNRMDEARKAYVEALGIYQRFAARDPGRFGKDVERTKALIEKLPTAN